jgi:hypothetical protein
MNMARPELTSRRFVQLDREEFANSVRIFVATIIGLLLLLLIAGWILPSTHHVSRIATFNQPPDALYAAITGPQDWRGVTRYVLPSDDGPRKWREFSGRWMVTYEEVDSNPPSLYRTRIIDPDLPFSGTWTYEITPTDSGCTCRITEDGKIKNPAFRLISRFVLGYTKSIDSYLKALGNKFNQPVTIEN